MIPGPILLLGAPGVGKGTQAQEIVKAWGIPQISTGDILRGNVARNTELGMLAKEIMCRGELVPDGLVNRMVAARLASRTRPTATSWMDFPGQSGRRNGWTGTWQRPKAAFRSLL